jgi:hypothetical protein
MQYILAGFCIYCLFHLSFYEAGAIISLFFIIVIMLERESTYVDRDSFQKAISWHWENIGKLKEDIQTIKSKYFI